MLISRPYSIEMDQTKRDTIPTIEPSLNHTTIGRLADNIDDYELVVSFMFRGFVGLDLTQVRFTQVTLLTPMIGISSLITFSMRSMLMRPFWNNSTISSLLSLVARHIWQVLAITRLTVRRLITPLVFARQARRTSPISITGLVEQCPPPFLPRHPVLPP